MAAENAKINTPEPRPLGTNIASLVRDFARMTDFQLQLLTLDVRQFWSSAESALTVSLLAGIAIAASLPVLLLGIAGILERVTGWSPDVCRLLIGTALTLCGASVLWMAVRRIGRAAECLKRSQEEFTQNLKWVREVLHQDQE